MAAISSASFLFGKANCYSRGVCPPREIVRQHTNSAIDCARLDTYKPLRELLQAVPCARQTPLCRAAASQPSWDNSQQSSVQRSTEMSTISSDQAILNKISLIGFIVSEPELIWGDDGTAVTNAWLEVKRYPGDLKDRFYLEIGGEAEEESLPEVVCNNVAVGDQVLVEGQLIIRQFLEGDVEVPMPVVQVDDLKKVAKAQGKLPGVVAATTTYGVSFSQLSLEDEWRNVFAHPEQYWDNRNKKRSERSPDFKHKTTGAALWITDRRIPSWVPESLQKLSTEFLPAQPS